jgi:poly-gamma-glutamate synthesis protein (capsule biosynthesis protein)
VNLETAVTESDDFDPGKGIHYRMHPDNVGCLTAAGFDVCTLANNHVLDFGRRGLVETLRTLERAGITTAGAGRDLQDARRPAVLPLTGGRLIVGACGHGSSGIPVDWAAGDDRPGVEVLPDLRHETAAALAARVIADRRAGDVAVVSIHWGDNWGYEVSREQVDFAHQLIDRGIDVVFGHSSHHVRPVEIYNQKLILHGCGDFINDYEGISGYESYRGDLALMFFPVLEPATGRLVTLTATPLQMRRLRLSRASASDTEWLCDTLNRISTAFGVRWTVTRDGALMTCP